MAYGDTYYGDEIYPRRTPSPFYGGDEEAAATMPVVRPAAGAIQPAPAAPSPSTQQAQTAEGALPPVRGVPTRHDLVTNKYPQAWYKVFPEDKPGYEAPHGWKKFGHIMGTIGQDIGEATFPQVMARIPGTNAYNREVLGGLGRAYGEEERQGLLEKEEARREKELHIPRMGETFSQQDESGNVARAWQVATDPMDPAHPYTIEIPVPGQQQAAPSAAPEALPPVGGEPQKPQPQAQSGMMPQVAAAQQAAPLGPVQMGKGTQYTREQLEEKRMMDLGARIANGETLPPDQDRFYRANRAKYENKLPIGPEGVSFFDQTLAGIFQGLDMPKGVFKADPHMSHADMMTVLRDATAQANNLRGVQKAYDLESNRMQEKDKRTPVYAVNPQSGELEKTNLAQANAWKATPREVSQGQEAQDAGLLRNLDDVVMNSMRFKKAMDAIPHDISPLAATNMANILSDKQLGVKFELFGIGLDTSLMNAAVKDLSVADSWNKLDPYEQDALIGYIRAKSSVIAYQKALTNSARFNERQLELEMANIPVPYVGSTVGDKQMNAWLENIDQASRGLPVNLPGQIHPKYLRQQLENEGPMKGTVVTPPPGARIRKVNPQTNQVQ